MKKLLIIFPFLLLALFVMEGCNEDEEQHADGHIHGTVVVHDEVNDVHNPLVGATVEMWFNKSSAQGDADFSTTTDLTGFFEFESLQSGVYYIFAHGTDGDNINREGSALVTLDENNHEVEAEIEAE